METLTNVSAVLLIGSIGFLIGVSTRIQIGRRKQLLEFIETMKETIRVMDELHTRHNALCDALKLEKDAVVVRVYQNYQKQLDGHEKETK